MSEVHAIPTVYKGIEFRSRLEAKWAAMFDQLGWPWEYEPVDLLGYIPDFVLKWDHGHTICEVKPATTVDELHKAIPKIERSGWDGEAMIVGASIEHTRQYATIGLLTARFDWPDDPDPSWAWAGAFSHECGSCRKISIHHEIGGWYCRLCGAWDGDHFLDPVDISLFWANATNAVKYDHGRR
jgi:hypothetical protein